MKLIDLERRLAQIEAARSITAPTALLTDAPIGDPAGEFEVADALVNWRHWVAKGKATISNGVLYLISPELSVGEWISQFASDK